MVERKKNHRINKRHQKLCLNLTLFVLLVMPVQYLLLILQKTFTRGDMHKVDREGLQTSDYGFPPKGDANMDFESTSPWGSRWKISKKNNPLSRPMLGVPSESKIFPTATDAEDLWLTQLVRTKSWKVFHVMFVILTNQSRKKNMEIPYVLFLCLKFSGLFQKSFSLNTALSKATNLFGNAKKTVGLRWMVIYTIHGNPQVFPARGFRDLEPQRYHFCNKNSPGRNAKRKYLERFYRFTPGIFLG